MKRPLRYVIIAVVVLVVLCLALPFFIDANQFRPTVEAELSTTLQRQVKIGNLKFSLLSGSLTADNLAVADDPAFSHSPFLTAQVVSRRRRTGAVDLFQGFARYRADHRKARGHPAAQSRRKMELLFAAPRCGSPSSAPGGGASPDWRSKSWSSKMAGSRWALPLHPSRASMSRSTSKPATLR